ncbi:hypothetical protein ACFWWS_36055 [Streptomyces sp. NPDC059083]|uniref:hypothetical protein n=1 Tax=Streptomyces sp. NPDC059083 TaxID=3346721 RepID=UPI0036A0C025
MSTFVTSCASDLRVSEVRYSEFSDSPAKVLVDFADKNSHGLAPDVTLFLEVEAAQALLAGLAVALGEHAIACRARTTGVEVQP